jgi:rubrerythrin
MPAFLDPFPGNVPREMTHGELTSAIMLDIAAELEAVHLYLAHMEATSNEEAKKVLFDIAQEELVHAGEFTSLLYRLDPGAGAKAREGFDEVQELLGSKSPYDVTPTENDEPIDEQTEAPSTPGSLTVGSLKE